MGADLSRRLGEQGTNLDRDAHRMRTSDVDRTFYDSQSFFQ